MVAVETVQHLYHALATHAHSCLYTTSAPEDVLVESFRILWRERTNPRTVTDGEKWSLDLIVPRDRNTFSFISPLDKVTETDRARARSI